MLCRIRSDVFSLMPSGLTDLEVVIGAIESTRWMLESGLTYFTADDPNTSLPKPSEGKERATLEYPGQESNLQLSLKLYRARLIPWIGFPACERSRIRS